MVDRSPEFDQVRRFMQNQPVEQNLASYTIESTLAHVRMLGETGIIERSDAELVKDALQQIQEELSQQKPLLTVEDFDIQNALERRVREQVGDLADVMRLAKSRNDQLATDMRLWLRNVSFDIFAELLSLRNMLITLADRDLEVMMPGYTHMQPAIPILLSHFWLAQEKRLARDFGRLSDFYVRMNALPLGACALAGTNQPIDRQLVAEYLGFDSVIDNSLDAVSDRDYLVEFGAFASLVATHISQLSSELLLWMTQEFGFAKLRKSFSFGSRSMPQKKNPALLEILRARPSSIYGALLEVLSQLKTTPIGFCQDLEESFCPLVSMVTNLKFVIDLAGVLLPAIEFDALRMKQVAGADLTNAGNAVDFLIARGIPQEKAAVMVEGLINYCQQRNKYLADLELNEWQQFCPAFDAEIYKYVTIEESIGSRSSFGGTGNEQVAQAISRARDVLHIDRNRLPQKAAQRLKVRELESI